MTTRDDQRIDTLFEAVARATRPGADVREELPRDAPWVLDDLASEFTEAFARHRDGALSGSIDGVLPMRGSCDGDSQSLRLEGVLILVERQDLVPFRFELEAVGGNESRWRRVLSFGDRDQVRAGRRIVVPYSEGVRYPFEALERMADGRMPWLVREESSL